MIGEPGIASILAGAAGLDLTGGSSTPPPRFYGDPADDDGPLLDPRADPADIARRVTKLWTDQEQIPTVRRRVAQARVNELRRKGIAGVRLARDPAAQWVPYASPTATPDSVPSLNHAAMLCRRTASVLFADPPAPLVGVGEGDSATNRSQAEMTARVLEDVQGPNRLDTPRKLRRAFDRASSTASAFLHYYIDPRGGGRAPIDVRCVPWASTIDEATRDPATGMAWQFGVQYGDGETWDGDYVSRYVTPEGNLTDDVTLAATRWTPGIRSEVLDSRNVRLVPHTAEDLWDADGVVICAPIAWREAVRKWPDALGKLSSEERDQIRTWRPQNAASIAPEFRREDLEPQTNPDNTLIFPITYYATACDDYPHGARVVALGNRIVVAADPWGWSGPEGWEQFLVPLSQVKQLGEGDDEPMGHGLMEILGPGNELLASVWGSFLDYLDDFGNRKLYMPLNSVVRAEDYVSRGKRIIPINPGGTPVHEVVPPYPVEGFKALDMIPGEMDHAISLEQAAQGLEDASVTSGVQQQTIIAQVHAGQSELRQNVERAYVRCCIIECQLLRAYTSTPHLIKYAGEDAEDRVESWTGTDLLSTRDIRLKPGSLSMMTPQQKEAVAMQYRQAGMITAAKLQEVIASGTGAVIGMQDDPHLRRVRRQMSRWKKGPPEIPPDAAAQYQKAVQQYQLAVQQQAAAAAQSSHSGVQPQQPQLQPPPHPFDAALGAIFDARPVDEDAQVATVRYIEIGELMASVDYERQPHEWRVGVDRELARAQQAMQAAQQSAATTKPPSEYINFKDLPLGAQVQMAAQAGLQLQQATPPAQPQQMAA